jgi:hypothetical protein
VKRLLIAAAFGLAVAYAPLAHADPIPHTPGGPPCNANDIRITKVDPETHNAIEDYGPAGCDYNKPMIGG